MENIKLNKINNKNYTLKEKARTFNNFNYKTWKKNSQKSFDKLPIHWAFGEQQFKELLQKLHLQDTKEDLQKLVNIGCGGLMLKSDLFLLKNHNETFSKEKLMFWLTHNFKFAYSALRYEMNNHEYYYSYDISDTLESLGLTFEDIQKNGYLKLAFLRAKKDYWAKCNAYNY
ncbi:MAG: hypothetical protein HFJ52_03090 [Clostridia bacterium]|nr:hypothetical protein [Clostridia bacterium]